MFDKIIKRILSVMPQKIGEIYYKHESIWLYLFFGALTTIVSFAAQYLAAYLGANTAIATTISWICTVTFAFFTNKAWVFKSVSETKKDFLKQVGQFYGARLFSYVFEIGFMILTVDVFKLNMYIMKIISQIFILTINYIFSKLVIFRKKTKLDKNDIID